MKTVLRSLIGLYVLFALVVPSFAQNIAARNTSFQVEKLVDRLDTPWSIAFWRDLGILLTERGGTMKLYSNGKLIPVEGVPAVATGGQAGLFDVLPVPQTKSDVFLSYAAAEGSNKTLKVVRATLAQTPQKTWKLSAIRTVFDGLRASGTPIHFGARLAILGDQTLLIAIGERGEMQRAQDPLDAAGKIHRIHFDGTIPKDNPFVGNKAYLPSIYSWGHRNIQGLWVDSVSGAVYATEHGPQGGDELNRILPGHNYGWPKITYGVNYGSGTKIGEGFEKPGLDQPILYWKPSIAPSGLTYYSDGPFREWVGSFFSGALAGNGISRFRISPTPVQKTGKIDRATLPANPTEFLVEEEYLLEGVVGRVRDVRVGQDGLIYLVTDSSSGALYRLKPLP